VDDVQGFGVPIPVWNSISVLCDMTMTISPYHVPGFLNQ